MATVFEAVDTRLGRTVAVKAIKAELMENPELRDRFLEEARIQATLAHPGAVPVFDSGTLDGGKLFYAMNRVQGKTLRDLLRERSPGELGERHALLRLVDIFSRVCQTVAYAHSHDVIHRDLKPGNVMVDDFDAVFVMDWGLAKRLQRDGSFDDSRTRTGVVMGTPGFMSPEQARGLADASDCQTDVFALGVILYRILTGRPPFKGASHEATVKEVLFHDPAPPLRLNRRAGRELSAICMKALAKDPRKRYADAGELADDIRRYREFRPVSAIRPRLVDRLAKWVRRRPVAASVLATLLLVAVGLAGYLGVQAHTERRLLGYGFERVDALRSEIDRIEAEIEDVRGQLAAAAPADRRRLVQRLAELEAQGTVKHWDLRGVLMAIIGRTIYSPDERALVLARQQTLRLIDVLLEHDDHLTAREFIEATLAQADDRNVLRFDPGQIQHMRELLVIANRGADGATPGDGAD
jgi:serine/threonine-protein kinase